MTTITTDTTSSTRSTRVFKSKVTLAGVAAALAVAAFGSTPLAHAGPGVPQKPTEAATLEASANATDLPPGPGATDWPPGPGAAGDAVVTAAAADLPPGSTAVGPDF